MCIPCCATAILVLVTDLWIAVWILSGDASQSVTWAVTATPFLMSACGAVLVMFTPQRTVLSYFGGWLLLVGAVIKAVVVVLLWWILGKTESHAVIWAGPILVLVAIVLGVSAAMSVWAGLPVVLRGRSPSGSTRLRGEEGEGLPPLVGDIKGSVV